MSILVLLCTEYLMYTDIQEQLGWSMPFPFHLVLPSCTKKDTPCVSLWDLGPTCGQWSSYAIRRQRIEVLKLYKIKALQGLELHKVPTNLR